MTLLLLTTLLLLLFKPGQGLFQNNGDICTGNGDCRSSCCLRPGVYRNGICIPRISNLAAKLCNPGSRNLVQSNQQQNQQKEKQQQKLNVLTTLLETALSSSGTNNHNNNWNNRLHDQNSFSLARSGVRLQQNSLNLPPQLVTTASQGTVVTGAYVYSCNSCDTGCCCGNSCCDSNVCNSVGTAVSTNLVGTLCTGCTSLCCCGNQCCDASHCGLNIATTPQIAPISGNSPGSVFGLQPQPVIAPQIGQLAQTLSGLVQNQNPQFGSLGQTGITPYQGPNGRVVNPFMGGQPQPIQQPTGGFSGPQNFGGQSGFQSNFQPNQPQPQPQPPYAGAVFFPDIQPSGPTGPQRPGIPNFGGLQPNYGGIQPNFGGLQPNFGGVQPNFGGAQPDFRGFGSPDSNVGNFAPSNFDGIGFGATLLPPGQNMGANIGGFGPGAPSGGGFSQPQIQFPESLFRGGTSQIQMPGGGGPMPFPGFGPSGGAPGFGGPQNNFPVGDGTQFGQNSGPQMPGGFYYGQNIAGYPFGQFGTSPTGPMDSGGAFGGPSRPNFAAGGSQNNLQQMLMGQLGRGGPGVTLGGPAGNQNYLGPRGRGFHPIQSQLLNRGPNNFNNFGGNLHGQMPPFRQPNMGPHFGGPGGGFQNNFPPANAFSNTGNFGQFGATPGFAAQMGRMQRPESNGFGAGQFGAGRFGQLGGGGGMNHMMSPFGGGLGGGGAAGPMLNSMGQGPGNTLTSVGEGPSFGAAGVQQGSGRRNSGGVGRSPQISFINLRRSSVIPIEIGGDIGRKRKRNFEIFIFRRRKKRTSPHNNSVILSVE